MRFLHQPMAMHAASAKKYHTDPKLCPDIPRGPEPSFATFAVIPSPVPAPLSSQAWAPTLLEFPPPASWSQADSFTQTTAWASPTQTQLVRTQHPSPATEPHTPGTPSNACHATSMCNWIANAPQSRLRCDAQKGSESQCDAHLPRNPIGKCKALCLLGNYSSTPSCSSDLSSAAIFPDFADCLGQFHSPWSPPTDPQSVLCMLPLQTAKSFHRCCVATGGYNFQIEHHNQTVAARIWPCQSQPTSP